MLDPPPDDALTKSVRGALKMVIGQNGGKVTGSTLDLATRQIGAQLRGATLEIHDPLGFLTIF